LEKKRVKTVPKIPNWRWYFFDLIVADERLLK
jgi:hypothetical protein